jgi:hypothetical protein
MLSTYFQDITFSKAAKFSRRYTSVAATHVTHLAVAATPQEQNHLLFEVELFTETLCVWFSYFESRLFYHENEN